MGGMLDVLWSSKHQNHYLRGLHFKCRNYISAMQIDLTQMRTANLMVLVVVIKLKDPCDVEGVSSSLALYSCQRLLLVTCGFC